MLPEAVDCTRDLDHHSMVQQPVEQRVSDTGVAEDIAPFRKAAVRGEDYGVLFVAGVNSLEELVAAARDDRQVSDLVDHKELWPCEVADALAQSPLFFGLGHRP